MNKDDVKKLDEVTAEEAATETQEAADELTSDDLDKVNGGGVITLKPKKWWDKIKGKSENEKDNA